MIRTTLYLATLMLINTVAYANGTDTNFDPDYQLGEQRFQRCATTNIKAMIFIEVGDAALYLNDCEQGNTTEYLLAIRYARSFTAKEFQDSSDVLIQRNVSEEKYQAIQDEVQRFNDAYLDVEPGDEYKISYTKAQGLELRKNNNIVTQSNSAELAQAYFKVWFGKRPFNKNMKKDLLQDL